MTAHRHPGCRAASMRDALDDRHAVAASCTIGSRAPARPSREPDLGFASGRAPLGLGRFAGPGCSSDDLAAGDFVRWTRQLVDLLGQLADVASGTVAVRARTAVSALRRGVVSATPTV